MSTGRVWLAAGVVAVIVALGVVLTVTGVFGGGDPATPPAAAAPSPTADTGGASVCGLTDVALSGTVDQAPADAQWALVGTIAAPSVPGQGPGLVEKDGFRSCFAHTPTGAVVAAANLAALGSYPPVRARFNEQALAPGPGRDAVLAKPAAQGGSDGPRLELVGFQLLRYTGDQADVDLALRSSTGSLLGFTGYLTWAEGDWKVRLADDGSDLSSVSPISALDAYLPWSAE
jgi:hypothetical protein